VLLVALGNPLQEQWIDEHLIQLGVPVSIGVGALFDYLAGRVPRAPRWMLRMRAEWLFRLLVEPRRLWRRYVMGNPGFVWRVLRSRGREQW
jgi:exopolysaccharide biosynthesis WecB/TagA/CpsF family protein